MVLHLMAAVMKITAPPRMGVTELPVRTRRPSLAPATHRPLTRHARHTGRPLVATAGLPCATHRPAAQAHDVGRRHGTPFRGRLVSPAVTLGTFLSQGRDADPSGRQALTRLRAGRTAAGRPRCSTNTGASGQARARLPEAVRAPLTRDTGAAARARAAAGWLGKGRAVQVADGTCLSMPDTPANQEASPQPPAPKPGCGFPRRRLGVVFSLAVGTVLDAAPGRSQGTGTGEQALSRSLGDGVAAGDVLRGDRNSCSSWVVAGARARGADVVRRRNAAWAKGLRACRRLGHGERPMRLQKPPRPGWMRKED